MLMYHPAQDINHSLYRLIMILETSEHRQIDIKVYRLIDFYTVFPYLLKNISTFPTPIHRHRSKFINIVEPFESLKNTKRIFHELEVLQSVAIQNLLAKDFLNKQAFEKGFLEISEKQLPEPFLRELESSRLFQSEWFKVLVNEFPKAKFSGKNGLKARTGLMEFKYDMEKS